MYRPIKAPIQRSLRLLTKLRLPTDGLLCLIKPKTTTTYTPNYLEVDGEQVLVDGEPVVLDYTAETTTDGVDTIGLLVEHYDSLTTDQQSFFFADASTPNTWTGFTTFYAAVSVQSWFNDENVMGTDVKGVAVYASDTSRYNLNKGLVWFGLPPILVYAFDPDEEIMIGPDETQVEVI